MRDYQEEFVTEKVGDTPEVSRVSGVDEDFGPGELVTYSNGAAMFFANSGEILFTPDPGVLDQWFVKGQHGDKDL